MAGAGDWARWRVGGPEAAYTLGIEEEVMLLEPDGWMLSQTASSVLATLPDDLARRVFRAAARSSQRREGFKPLATKSLATY